MEKDSIFFWEFDLVPVSIWAAQIGLGFFLIIIVLSSFEGGHKEEEQDILQLRREYDQDSGFEMSK